MIKKQNKENSIRKINVKPCESKNATSSQTFSRAALSEIMKQTLKSETSLKLNLSNPVNEEQGQSKLLELTAQCVNYFDRFTTEKDIYLSLIKKVFTQIMTKVNDAFGLIIQQAKNKIVQISHFLERQQNRLIEQKKKQQNELNSLLTQIKQVHLTKLLSIDQESFQIDLSSDYASYAKTLQEFFNAMMNVQKNTYEDNVDQCISFINNLVREELKIILEDKYPKKIQDFLSVNSNDNCFTFQCGNSRNEDSMSLFDNFERKKSKSNDLVSKNLKIIKQNQIQRAKKIKDYSKYLSLDHLICSN